MTRASVRRLGAAGFLFVCLIALPGRAGADGVDALPTLAVVDASAQEGAPVKIKITLSAVDAADVTVAVATSGGSGYTDRDETVTIPAGETSVDYDITTQENDLDQPDRQFTVTLSGPSSNATIGDATGTGTITDDDATPTLAITGPATIAETGTAGYTVAISGKSAAVVTVNWATVNGTAANGDYGPPRSGSLNWPAGGIDSAPRSISIPMVNDTVDEPDETFSVTLSSPTGATIATATAATTITDDDDEVSVGTISNVTVTEGNSGTVDASVTVTLSAPSGKTVTVPYATAPLSATEGVDYEQKSGNYVFAPGDTTETVVFKVKGDTVFEQDEKFSIVLTDPINGAPGTDMRGEVTITDDDSSPAPTVNNASVAEGNSGLTDLVFDVTLPCPRPAVTFNYRTVADTATASDFTEVGGATLSFNSCAAGASTVLKITIKVKGDTLDEVNESFKLELLNPTTGAVVRTAVGTITNDDNNSKLSIGDASSDEPGTLTFPVTLSQASAREVKINWATADGTATAGSDYTAGGGTLTFAPGETAKNIAVAVLGDGTTEENETMKVILSGPVGVPDVNVIDGEGAGTIIDRNAPPSLSISDALGREGGGVTFTVSLAGTTLRTVTVRFNTADGTAKAPADYAGRAGTLTFEPGEKSKTIAVSIVDDAEAEPVEEFFVTIGDAVNATITKNRGEGSIEASDRPDAPPTTDPTTKPPVAKPASVLVPRMILGPRTVSIGANGLARMLVTCQKLSPIGCAGSVELERATKPLLKLGKKTFTVKKGAKGYASIKLNLKTLKLLQKNGTMRAKVIVLVKTSTKTMKVSPGIITLRATLALKKAKLKPPAPSTKVVVDP